MANGHGGPRPNSGRPKGGHNRLPSKSSQLLERLYDQVEPEYKAIVQELVDIALGRSLKASKDPLAAQLRAIEYVLDRLLGKAPEFVETDQGDRPSASRLVDLWNEQGETDGRTEV